MVTNGSGRYARRGEVEWRRMMSEQAASGMRIDAYCQQHGISVANFYRWRRLLATGAATNHRVGESPFVELGTLTPGHAGKTRIDFRLTLGTLLSLHLVRD